MSRQYLIVCPSCRGLGWIDNPARVGSSASIICPACNGTKVVTVIENSDNCNYGNYYYDYRYPDTLGAF